MMQLRADLQARVGRFAPAGSAKQKLLRIFGIVFLLEGLSVIFLTSKFGAIVGLISIVAGLLVLLLVPPSGQKVQAQARRTHEEEPIGLRLIDRIIRVTGGVYSLVVYGAAVIVAVVIHDSYFSANPGLGDIDMLAIMFGLVLFTYPFISVRFRMEAGFALMFIFMVTIILVVPLSFLSVGSAGSTSGNWYVHALLAAPLAGCLNLFGIPASSVGASISVEFHDGTTHWIGISTGCAGLYSTTIFLSAFIAFVLVFERLPPKTTAIVLAIGLIVAYLGNLLRMILIVVIGYYNGMDALTWAHKNIGWMIFLSWSAIFWYLVMRYADKHARMKSGTAGEGSN